MGDAGGNVAAAGLAHVVLGQVAQVLHGVVAAAQAVQQDGAAGVHGVDGLHGLAHHPAVGLGADVKGLVEQVVAHLVQGLAPVALGEQSPVMEEAIQRLLVLPEVEALDVLVVDAVARPAVEGDVDVDAVGFAPADGLIHRFQLALVDLPLVAVLNPEQVGQGQAHEVEAPVRDQLKVLLVEMPRVAGLHEHAHQVEAAPARQLGLLKHGIPPPLRLTGTSSARPASSCPACGRGSPRSPRPCGWSQ